MKKIIFSKKVPDSDSKFDVIDLRGDFFHERNVNYDKNLHISLSPVFKEFGPKWAREFSQWIGGLNGRDQDVYWWAYRSTEKNLLSTPLGENFFQVKAVFEIIKKHKKEELCVVGATYGQVGSIVSMCSELDVVCSSYGCQSKLESLFGGVETLLRLFFQTISIFLGSLWGVDCKSKSNVDIAIFTYLDSKCNSVEDRYFGLLHEMINKAENKRSVMYLAYADSPMKDVKRIIKEKTTVHYALLYNSLNIFDCLWVLKWKMELLWRMESLLYLMKTIF